MLTNRATAALLPAAVALVIGFLLTGLLKSHLIPPTSDQVARYQALTGTVQRLQDVNQAALRQIALVKSRIDRLEAAAAQGSGAARTMRAEVQDLRSHAGLTGLRGPGVTITLGDGKPLPGATGDTRYLVDFQDVEEVVNLAFAGGAEAVAVNGRRLTPASSFQGSGRQVVLDQGPPMTAPFKIAAIGDRNRMEIVLGDPSTLGDIRMRQTMFGLHLAWAGSPSLTVPGYQAGLEVRYAKPA